MSTPPTLNRWYILRCSTNDSAAAKTSPSPEKSMGKISKLLVTNQWHFYTYYRIPMFDSQLTLATHSSTIGNKVKARNNVIKLNCGKYTLTREKKLLKKPAAYQSRNMRDPRFRNKLVSTAESILFDIELNILPVKEHNKFFTKKCLTACHTHTHPSSISIAPRLNGNIRKTSNDFLPSIVNGTSSHPVT